MSSAEGHGSTDGSVTYGQHRPLRVALDTTYAGVNRTGVGIYSRRLAARLLSEGNALRLDVRCYGPACVEEATPIGIRGNAQEWSINTHGLLPLRMAAFRPDVVHATSHIGPLWGPGRLVITVHDLIFMHHPADYNPLWLAITRATLPGVLARARAVIADSYTTRKDIRRFLKIPQRKLHVVYPGIDHPPAIADAEAGKTPDMLRNLGMSANARYIICVGPWVRRKNLPVVLEAFQIISREEPDLHLVITGTGAAGMKGPAPEQLISRMSRPMQEKVHCMGFVERQRLYLLLSGAALLAYPSRIEGFGLPPLEAMSMGTPVVTSEAAVLREVTGGACLTALIDDPHAWAQAFRRVLQEPGLALHLKEMGKARSSEFSWQRCVEETVNVYRQVAGVSGQAPGAD